MPGLLLPGFHSNIADLNTRIQALDTSLSGSALKKAASSRDELLKEKENDNDNDSDSDNDNDNDDDSIPSDINKSSLSTSCCRTHASFWEAWEKEWASLRVAELKLSKQHRRGETAATVLKRDGRAAWVARNQSMVDWQTDAGWSTSQAEAYTCIALGGQTAIGHDLREGGKAFGACREVLFAMIAERALLSTADAPPTYRHLTGRYSLSATDPSWAALLSDDAAPGLSFTTTALTIATDDASAIDAKGYRVGLSRAGGLGRRVEHFHELTDSDVVCFRALPTEVDGTPVDEHGRLEGAPPRAHTARRLVQTSPVAWHLPPLATVTLAQIVPAGEWSAYGRAVARRLLVAHVAFECAGPPPGATRC